jgi:hypothetical protein
MSEQFPEGYLDGCTIGPQKFGKVSHKDICIEHDIDWWSKRTVWEKIKSDWSWCVKIIKRHYNNGVWLIPAVLYGILGFIFLNTLGWFWWRNK